jgi:electron transfer flavoprotein beta subunit
LKIAVCIKQVASTNGPLQMDVGAGWLREADTTFEINAADNHALEAGLAIRDRLGGEVLVVSLGSDRVTAVLRDALAKGADRAIHVVHEAAHKLDPARVAEALAEVLRDEACDLVLCGLQSDDAGHGQTGALLAECLGWPLVGIVAALDVETPKKVRARRELEAGWSQWLELPPPCVLTIQSGINKPRYAGMKGMLAAKKKPITRVEPILAGNMRNQQVIEQIYFPHRDKQTRLLEGAPVDAAAQLVAMLNLRGVQ